METVQEKKKVACDVNKVRSSNEDIKNEKLTAPNERMVKEGWGLGGTVLRVLVELIGRKTQEFWRMRMV